MPPSVTPLPAPQTRLLAQGRVPSQSAHSRTCAQAISCARSRASEIIDTWIDDGAAEMASAGINGNAIREETETQFDNYERLTNRLFDAISQLLMPMHKRLSRQRH